MKWMVYWQAGDVEFGWFKTEADDEDGVPHWDITLLEVRGEVHESPDGLRLVEVAK